MGLHEDRHGVRSVGQHVDGVGKFEPIRGFHTSAVIVGKLYVFGGETRGSRIASVDAYDPISNTWAQVSDT